MTRRPSFPPVLLAVILLMPTAPAATGEPAPLAEVVEKERLVEVGIPPVKPWEPATLGKGLVKRERVAARDLSRATIRLSDDRMLRVNANTELVVLPSLLGSRPLGLEVAKGEIYLHSRGPRGGLGLKTPVVEGVPDGTQFRILVEDDGTTTFTMIEGTVELTNAQGRLKLGNLEQAIIEPGRAPRLTARIDARNVIQWCLYYPGVIDPRELAWIPGERRPLAGSLAAYSAGDLPGALAAWPAGYAATSTSAREFRAMLLLSVGQVAGSREALAGVPADSAGRRAIEELIDAVNFVDRPLPRPPRTAGEWLARSYFEQSRARLETALAAAREAARISPEFGFAAVRVAELEFSFGRTRSAMKELDRGLGLSPRNAQAHVLQGFLLCDRNCIPAARDWFEAAIRLDSALGTAWLGRGLCDIRQGEVEKGIRDIQTATILEPNRSLFHSYRGKAASLAGLRMAAAHDLDFAQRLDPADPTPLLYSALELQQQNRPNEAIADLERSILLNDNRRVYRSRFLLDQDRAVRSANLAKIYQNAGMQEVAVREAGRAVESDYTNPSAHLFLANSFDALRDPKRIQLRYETPWFNELLLANLLSPVGGGPLSQFVSQQEYSRLLESDGLGGSIVSEIRSSGESRTAASVFGQSGNMSFGIDAYHRDDSGDRFNSEASLQELYGQFKWQVTPDDIFYFLGKWQDQRSGDNFDTYNNLPLEPQVDFRETQQPGLLLAGWNHRWAPGSNTLFLAGRLGAEQQVRNPDANQLLVLRDAAGLRPEFLQTDQFGFDAFSDPSLDGSVSVAPDGESLVYSADLLRAIQPYLGRGEVLGVSGSTFSVETRRSFEVDTAEIQHILQSDRNLLIAGGRFQSGEFETDTRLLASRPNFDGGFETPAALQHSTVDFDRLSLYAYDYWKATPALTLIGGMAWDRIEHPDNFRYPPVNDLRREDEEFSGKLGFTYRPSSCFAMRGVYTEGLGGVSFEESVRLEPVQLAGFNQAYRTVISESVAGSVEAPDYMIGGLSFEGALPTRTWWGASVNVIEQEVERTKGIFTGYNASVFPISPGYFADSTPEHLDYREESVAMTLNQLVGDQFSLGAGLRITRSELETTLPGLPVAIARLKDEATLTEVMLSANWNSPTGWFARLEANWLSQDIEDDPSRLPVRPGDSFWQFNALAGYRFHRSRCEITAGVLNLGDTDYQLSPLNPRGEIVRDRTAVLRVRYNF